jgi:uncharacterized membrane protein
VTPPSRLVFAVCVLGGALGAVMFPAGYRVTQAATAWLASRLRRLGLFRVSDLSSELLRLDVLRIALGLLVFARFWTDFVSASNPIARSVLGGGLLLSGALTLGIATPIAALLLAFSLNLVIDYYSGNYSLGSMVVANCLIPLVIAPAGYTLSVDAQFLRRPTMDGALVRSIYGVWGAPDVDRIQVGRFLALLAYVTISLYSAVRHLASPTWTEGAATGVLLLSDVASPDWSTIFSSVYDRAHAAFIVFSVVATYGMLLWQLALLPLALLSRWTRRFVIVWGLLFFAFSTYVLHLKRLGVYEVVLWALIFWNWAPPLKPAIASTSLRRGRLAHALAACVVVLWGMFLVIWSTSPRAVNEDSAGNAPMVFGIGFVNVFNEGDFLLFRHRVTARRSGTRVGFTPTEAVDRALTRRYYRALDLPQFCDQGYAEMWFGAFAESQPQAVQKAALSMEFLTWTQPTNRQLARFRHVPIIWETTCVVPVNFDFEPTPPRVRLASRFPCSLERAVAARWWDRTARPSADRGTLDDLFRAEQQGEFACLSAYKRLMQRLGAADQRSAFLPLSETCESELAIAQLYVSEVFDERLRQTTLPTLDAVRAAQQQGRMEDCRQGVGEIRRAYFDAIYGPD